MSGTIQGEVKEATIDNFRNFESKHGIDRIRALAEWGLYEDALNVANACIVLQPGTDNARYNRGSVLAHMGRYAEAIFDFTSVIEYKNENKRPSAYQEQAFFSRGYCNLGLGNLVEGFREYEPRRHQLMELPNGPHYDGTQDISGKTLFVVGENTLSENLLFSRYLPLVKADTVVAVPPHSSLLFHTIPGVRLATRAIGHFDYWCTLMSLAVVNKTTTSTIPSLATFNLPLENTIRWRPKLGLLKSRRIGLCWSGPECKGNIPLELLSSLFENECVEFYCFQDEVGNSDKQAFDRLDIWNMGLKFKTFVDAACAMKSMDLLITVDNAIAHLAGTLNIPCWLLLPKYRMHWLWGSRKNTCPWYPSMKIFRQFNDGDWTSVMTEVHKSLVEFCRL